MAILYSTRCTDGKTKLRLLHRPAIYIGSCTNQYFELFVSSNISLRHNSLGAAGTNLVPKGVVMHVDARIAAGAISI